MRWTLSLSEDQAIYCSQDQIKNNIVCYQSKKESSIQWKREGEDEESVKDRYIYKKISQKIHRLYGEQIFYALKIPSHNLHTFSSKLVSSSKVCCRTLIMRKHKASLSLVNSLACWISLKTVKMRNHAKKPKGNNYLVSKQHFLNWGWFFSLII